MYNRKDFYLVALIGFLVGWLVLLPAKNVGIEITIPVAVALIVGFTIFAPTALFVLKLLSRKFTVFEQFGKFAAVGTLNTLLDIGVLNVFMAATGETKGWAYAAFKTISFLVAATNSYLWNKFWTFQSKLPVTTKEYARFLAFTLVGTLINVSVASLVVSVIGAPSGFDEKLWANIGAIVAVAASFMWNFLSYRNIVFKAKIKT